MTACLRWVLYDRRGRGANAPPRSNRHLVSGVLILIALLAALPPRLAAQVDNLERIRECARLLSDSIISSNGPRQEACLDLVRHQASWLLEEGLIAAAAGRSVRLDSCQDTVEGGRSDRLTVAITSIGVWYEEIDDEELLARNVRIEATALIPPPAGAVTGSRSSIRITQQCRDTVRADQTSLLEASGYDFARGAPPPQGSSGFWKKVVEPAVVIGASVVLVILLFTVRSQ